MIGSPLPLAMKIRFYEPRDLPALYRICLLTGEWGQDATARYRDPALLGHIFAAPYALLEPQSCLVAEDREGVGAYIVGTQNTVPFEQSLEREWWPGLRALYSAGAEDRQKSGSYDARTVRMIHNMPRTPEAIAGAYPAHLHINLVPRMQGQSMGRTLMAEWLNLMRGAGSVGVHLATGARNGRAVRFYHRYGFNELARSDAQGSIIWFGMRL